MSADAQREFVEPFEQASHARAGRGGGMAFAQMAGELGMIGGEQAGGLD